MVNSKIFAWIKLLQILLLLLVPVTLHASFIEATMGAAVVNDATAVYYNPAALALLKNPQAISLNSEGHLHTKFTGQATQTATGFTQTGTSTTESQYILPTFYLAVPLFDKFTIGLAGIWNAFNKDIDGTSPLRYSQSNNSIRSFDLVPAAEFKLTDFLSIGAAANFSYANFLLKPTIGFPTLNIPDTESRNEADGSAVGGDVGLLLRPTQSTIIGFNYRSSMTYHLSGTSVFESDPPVVSNQYGFTFWTPGRSVLSISQFLTKNFGLIGTIQRINWSIFRNIDIRGIATKIGPRSIIFNASAPFFLRDTWLVTLGSQYRITPNWVIRVASSYNQSPGNPNFQVCNGDSIILGTSMGYKLSKNIVIDGGYAHAFIQNQNINVATNRNIINGVTNGFVNAVSLKVTFNLI